MAKAERNAFKPNYAVPPGETLRETLESLGLGYVADELEGKEKLGSE